VLAERVASMEITPPQIRGVSDVSDTTSVCMTPDSWPIAVLLGLC
jgi:hypothetical protein